MYSPDNALWPTANRVAEGDWIYVRHPLQEYSMLYPLRFPRERAIV